MENLEQGTQKPEKEERMEGDFHVVEGTLKETASDAEKLANEARSFVEKYGKEGLARLKKLLRGNKAKAIFAALLMTLNLGKASAKDYHTDFEGTPTTEKTTSRGEEGGKRATETYTKVLGVEEDDNGNFVLLVEKSDVFEQNLDEEDFNKVKDSIGLDREASKILGIKKEVTEKKEVKEVLFNRKDLGPLALVKNSDGRYALQFELKGNMLIVKFNNRNSIFKEQLENILSQKNYNIDALKKIARQVHVKVLDVDGKEVAHTTFYVRAADETYHLTAEDIAR